MNHGALRSESLEEGGRLLRACVGRGSEIRLWSAPDGVDPERTGVIPMAFQMQLMWALALASLLPTGFHQTAGLPRAARDSIDAAVSEAYEAAAAAFPCKVKRRGRPRMMRWEDVDRCLNNAVSRVDWDELSRRLESVRASTPGYSPAEFTAAVEASLSAGALTLERLFVIKDEKVLLPLTNSLLKYLPADSLMGLPVSDKVGTQVGTFAGIYSYERTGGLATANKYRLTLFQYNDRNGNVQSPFDKLLLDSFGVPWRDARSQPGFRLPSDRLALSP
ncbi:MAG: hypothetical protein HXY20_11820 [Acidobacteria bacterium]|nr:hypothetical protein [Acidobacteriota bacterium]